jgi:hypothetical protein
MNRLISFWSEASSRNGSHRTSVAMLPPSNPLVPVAHEMIKTECMTVKSVGT